MASSAHEAEATGQTYVVATYEGHDFKLPLDADRWPLPTVAASIGFLPAELRYQVNFGPLIAAVAELLGDQWAQFMAEFPQRRHLVPVSNAFAAAAGFPADPSQRSDLCFGGLPRLVGILERYPDKVEADLAQFWGLDYLDRWRHDDDGRPLLTLRAIAARLNNLPTGSALAAALRRYSVSEQVLMDVYEGVTGRPHRMRPLTEAELEERRKAASKAEKERTAREDYRRRHGHRQGVAQARDNARQLQGRQHDQDQDQDPDQRPGPRRGPGPGPAGRDPAADARAARRASALGRAQGR